MEANANKTVIGLFVVGAAALLVIAVLVFGGSKWGVETTRFVLFFEGSVTGLNTGAPVALKGVKIGSVIDITLQLNWENLDFQTQVLIETSQGSSIVETAETVGSFRGADKEALLRRMVERGLRASLELQSMVTGLQMIALDFYPEDREPRLVGAAPDYLEVPTITTGIAKMTETLKQIPIGQIAANLNRAVEGLQELINSDQTKDTLTSLNKTMKELAGFSSTLNARAEPVLDNLDGLLRDGRKLAQNVDGQIDPLVTDFRGAAQAATSSLATAEGLLAGFQGLAPRDSALAHEITTTLRSVSGAMNSVKNLATYLERHPEALLMGK